MIFSSICAAAGVGAQIAAAAISKPRQIRRDSDKDMACSSVIERLLRAAFAATSRASVRTWRPWSQPAKPPPSRKACSSGVVVAAEHGVAVREAAEAADDVGVQLRPFQQLRRRRWRGTARAALLVGQRFRMLERQIEELPLAAAAPAGRSRVRSRGRRPARASGSAAKARALPRNMLRGNWSSTIDERQRALRRSLPMRKLAARRRPRRSAGSARGSRRRTRRPW